MPEFGSWGGGLGDSGNARKKTFLFIEAFPYLSKVLHHLKTQLSFKTPDDMCLETRRSVKEANNGRAWVVEPEGFNKDLNDLFRTPVSLEAARYYQGMREGN